VQVGESERFTSFDGTGIAYRRWAGTRGPVVLHHGFVANGKANWVLPGVVDRLVSAAYEVVAIDARGHGRSDKPHDPARYGEPTMARDVSSLADHLGYEGFALVGYSMGGIVSLLVAIDEPRVQRLVVGGIGAGVVEVGGVDTREIPREAIAEALLADDPDTLPNVRARGFRAFADAMGADRLALAAQASVAHQEPMALDRISAPTLVLVGEDDDLARRPSVLAEAIPGARLALVPGDHLGACAEPAFGEHLLAFLEETDARTE
jgi:pimeloyl-ACP methyl ester carboxylesterase